jgi:hypothetical protein
METRPVRGLEDLVSLDSLLPGEFRLSPRLLPQAPNEECVDGRQDHVHDRRQRDDGGAGHPRRV